MLLYITMLCVIKKQSTLNKIFPFIFFLFISIFFGFSQEIKLNLKSGETYFHNTTTNALIIQDIHGEKHESDIFMDGLMSFYVKKKIDSLYDIDVKFERMKCTIKSNEMELTANSEIVDTTNLFNIIIKEMIEKPFQITISNTGLIKKIEMSDVFDNLFGFDPDIPKLVKAKIIYQLKQSFGEEAMKGSIEMLTSIYPDKTVSIGDTWQNETELKTISTSSMRNKFELMELNDEFAIIKSQSSTKDSDGNSFIKLNGDIMRFSSEGTMSAIHKIDLKTGWLLETEIIQTISGLTEKKWKYDSPIILKIPFEYKGKINITTN